MDLARREQLIRDFYAQRCPIDALVEGSEDSTPSDAVRHALDDAAARRARGLGQQLLMAGILTIGVLCGIGLAFVLDSVAALVQRRPRTA